METMTDGKTTTDTATEAARVVRDELGVALVPEDHIFAAIDTMERLVRRFQRSGEIGEEAAAECDEHANDLRTLANLWTALGAELRVMGEG